MKKHKQRRERLIRIIKSVGKILLWIVIELLTVVVILSVVNQIALSIENKNIAVIGQRVEVYDGQYMNVYTAGSGDQTIVLLSGFSTPSPVTDFKKLADNLRAHYRVVVVEYFGYGFSDQTNTPRTNENIVNEMRIALKKSRVDGPYILMPHSISGIYAMYYAQKHPSEIKAIIGLDAAVSETADYINENEMKISPSLSLMSNLGLTRFAVYVFPTISGYTQSVEDVNQDFQDIARHLTIKNFFNPTIIKEGNASYHNQAESSEFKYPATTPVLDILSSDSVDLSLRPAQPEDWPFPKNWVRFHESLQTNTSIQKIEVVDGSHYIHHGNVEKISNLVDNFVETSL